MSYRHNVLVNSLFSSHLVYLDNLLYSMGFLCWWPLSQSHSFPAITIHPVSPAQFPAYPRLMKKCRFFVVSPLIEKKVVLWLCFDIRPLAAVSQFGVAKPVLVVRLLGVEFHFHLWLSSFIKTNSSLVMKHISTLVMHIFPAVKTFLQ